METIDKRYYKTIILDEWGYPYLEKEYNTLVKAIESGKKVMVEDENDQFLGYCINNYYRKEVTNSWKEKDKIMKKEKFTRFDIMDV